MDERQVLHLLWWQRWLGKGLFQRPQHQRERGTKFVADVGKESGFGAVDLRQRFSAPLLILVGLGVADGGAELTSHQAEKASVVVVRQAKRIEPRDQKSGPSCFASRRDRQDNGLVRWVLPNRSRERRAEVLGQIGQEVGIAIVQHLRQRPGRQ